MRKEHLFNPAPNLILAEQELVELLPEKIVVEDLVVN